MDQHILRSRSASSPPVILIDRFFNNILNKTSSLDGNTVPLTVSLFDKMSNYSFIYP
jgi:hypothetical protein